MQVVCDTQSLILNSFLFVFLQNIIELKYISQYGETMKMGLPHPIELGVQLMNGIACHYSIMTTFCEIF